MWKLNHTLLNKWVKEKVTREIRKYIEMKIKKNLWDTVKAVFRRKFVAVNAYIKKEKRSQINKLTPHLKVEKEEQTKLKTSRRKKIIGIGVVKNDIEKR